MEKGNYWICIAGPVEHSELKEGADNLPRRAVIKAIEGMGHEVESYSTGWGANEKVAERVQQAWNGQRVFTESEVNELVKAGNALSVAMKQYEIDVDEDAPYKHREMMSRWEDVVRRFFDPA